MQLLLGSLDSFKHYILSSEKYKICSSSLKNKQMHWKYPQITVCQSKPCGCGFSYRLTLDNRVGHLMLSLRQASDTASNPGLSAEQAGLSLTSVLVEQHETVLRLTDTVCTRTLANLQT